MDSNIYKDNDGNIIIDGNIVSSTTTTGFKDANHSDSLPPLGQTVSVADILTRIDYIISETEYLTQSIDAIRTMQPASGHDITSGEKAKAIQKAVESRETTNQRILGLLEKMYDDMRPSGSNPDDRQDIVKILQSGIHTLGDSSKRAVMDRLLEKIL